MTSAMRRLARTLALACLLPAATLAAPGPGLAEVRNATYQGLDGVDGPVTLNDGQWEGAPYIEGAVSRPRVYLGREFLFSADLDADGVDEAVVFPAVNLGGSGGYVHVAVLARRAGRIENVATRPIGDRVQVRGVRVEAIGDRQALIVDVVRAGPEDPACCPGEVTSHGWTLDPDGTLVPVDVAGATSRLSLETLSGREWVLRAWNFDEPAPATPEVTLAVSDGRLVGRSGCNRYFADVEAGRLPGDVAVGPAGSTRMACPPPIMEVEQRFLAQLAAVRKYGFMLGQLALTYEKDAGLGVMLFQGRDLDPGPEPGR